ncbi:MAG: ATP phosphoribosyltransferase regulatory subunit, partial [Chloroflexi bacterium]|nr:ATP phosphoribosyltransferase regulatory subunit [Chloroflexota bacterium]
NTIGDTASRAKVNDALRAYFSTYEAELDEDCRERLEKSVLRIFDCKVPRDREIAAGAPKVRDLVSDEDRAHFASVLEGLDRLGIRYEVDDMLVRGFDYYTRTVFELILTDPEFTKAGRISVAGGGRYDGLVRTMGGPEVPGIGVAGGIEVLHAALTKQGVSLGGEPAADVYIVSDQADDIADRHQLAEPLRDAGFTVAIDYTARPLDRQLESAAKHGARVAVIRGTEEARGGNVIVRDLVKKEQRVTRLAAVVAEVRRHVPQRAKPVLDPPTGGLQSD